MKTLRARCPIERRCHWRDRDQAHVHEHIVETHPDVLAPLPREQGRAYAVDVWAAWELR